MTWRPFVIRAKVDEPVASPSRGMDSGPKGVTLSKARRVYRRLASKGDRVTGAALGRSLGVSGVMGRIWLRRVRDSIARRDEA